ncbi:MAG: element excision factor XisI family protein [Aggregatilineales bacterium]
MADLKSIVEHEMREYAGEGINGQTYFTHDDQNNVMTIVFSGIANGKSFSTISIFARIVNDMIIIDEDKTNKPLVDALVQSGIPREKIVLSYAGESVQTV